MPYYTGTANSAADLRQSIINAGLANGWSWDPAYGMLYKGDIYAKLTTSGIKVHMQGALGYSGETLVSPTSSSMFIGDVSSGGNTPLSYPITYHIFVHESPSVIICAVNYQSSWWQWMMFGQAVNLGVEGKCTFYFATFSGSSAGISLSLGTPYGGGAITTNSGAPFWPNNSGSLATGSYINLDIDGPVWRSETNSSDGYSTSHASSRLRSYPELMMQPNTWNGDVVLSSVIVSAFRPSSLWSYAAELNHIRYVRNDYLFDGQIITIGSDRWFVAPSYRKNATRRSGSDHSDPNHSGTLSFAVRYDGP